MPKYRANDSLGHPISGEDFVSDPKPDHTTRRAFLETAGAGALASLLLGQEDALAQPAASPASGVAKDMPVSLQPNGADVGSVFPFIERLGRLHDFEYSFLGDRFKSLDEFKRQSREKVLEALLYRPRPVAPRAEIVERDDLGDIIREKIVFSTTPEFRVPAYVQFPKRLKAPAPAIIDLHSHGGMIPFGKEKVTDLGPRNHPVMKAYHDHVYDGRATGTALARRGYVVISIDAFFFGERRTILDDDLKKYGYDRSRYSVDDCEYLRKRCSSKESTLVKALLYAGMTWQGIICWDDMRTVDYLLTRPEVDPKRIGCNGISLGGYRSLFLAGLDERIAAANVVGFMSTVRSMIHAHLDTHSWAHFPPAVHRYLDLPDVVSMMAPKPLLVQQCTHDALYPLAGMQDSVKKIAAVYDKAGVKDRFSGRFYDTRHRFTRQMQDEAFAFFDAALKN